MKRLGLVAVLLGLAAVPVGLAGSPTSDFTISTGRGEYLEDRKGELFLVGYEATWYVGGTQIRSNGGGGYLVYDPNGEDNMVVLKSKPGKDAEWSVVVPGKGRSSEGKRAVIRAASGNKKGWYLTLEWTTVEEDGRKVPIRYLALSKDPPLKLKVKRLWKH